MNAMIVDNMTAQMQVEIDAVVEELEAGKRRELSELKRKMP